MGKYSEYNIIPIGDHCAISMILRELNLRDKSYPFDWVSHKDHLTNTNILYNIKLIDDLKHDSVESIVKKYIGDAFDNNNINSNNEIMFPHESCNIIDTFQKYTRRFNRLNQDLGKKNLFILLTRHFYIKEEVFKQIMTTLLSYNTDSKFLFISGTDHTYFQSTEYSNVIFKHIHYDISKIWNYDYDSFRPNIKAFLSELLL